VKYEFIATKRKLKHMVESKDMLIERLHQERNQAQNALKLILENVDYQRGNCRPNELVGAVLPPEILQIARTAAGQ